MRKSIAAAIAFTVMSAGSAHADDEAPPLTQPMKFGDQAMSCAEIVDEVGAMEARLGGDPSQSLMDGEQLAGIGTGYAQQAAISAGAGGAAVGAIGKVGGLLGSSSKKKKKREAEEKIVAEKRWLYMVGLYHGKACAAQPAAAE